MHCDTLYGCCPHLFIPGNDLIANEQCLLVYNLQDVLGTVQCQHYQTPGAELKAVLQTPFSTKTTET